ncbi:hypothetical protein PR048_023957 [Dryococelus australis]|uniref:Uncharacterized protein n=1 Tax=Dryococelus australis TaxID=614101 RepID=A0ABQ9GVI5_9NEOP|nr:hypothetical protein PR048_023957 [Dryococelus australis]
MRDLCHGKITLSHNHPMSVGFVTRVHTLRQVCADHENCADGNEYALALSSRLACAASALFTKLRSFSVHASCLACYVLDCAGKKSYKKFLCGTHSCSHGRKLTPKTYLGFEPRTSRTPDRQHTNRLRRGRSAQWRQEIIRQWRRRAGCLPATRQLVSALLEGDVRRSTALRAYCEFSPLLATHRGDHPASAATSGPPLCFSTQNRTEHIKNGASIQPKAIMPVRVARHDAQNVQPCKMKLYCKFFPTTYGAPPERKAGGKREIAEKTRRLTASSGTCENPGVTGRGSNPEQANRSATVAPSICRDATLINMCSAVGLFAPHHAKRVQSPLGSLPVLSQLEIVPDDAAGWRRLFSGFPPPLPGLAFRRCAVLVSLHLILPAERIDIALLIYVVTEVRTKTAIAVLIFSATYPRVFILDPTIPHIPLITLRRSIRDWGIGFGFGASAILLCHPTSILDVIDHSPPTHVTHDLNPEDF